MSFSSETKNATDKIRSMNSTLVRAWTIEVMGRIVRRTPVAEGRLRGNWNASIGSPDLSTSEAVVSGPEVIRRAQNVLSRMEIGETSYFTNNLPYAYTVEMGSSQQAPMGMMRLSVLEAGGTID
jgi:hypothetical protein